MKFKPGDVIKHNKKSIAKMSNSMAIQAQVVRMKVIGIENEDLDIPSYQLLMVEGGGCNGFYENNTEFTFCSREIDSYLEIACELPLP